MSGLLKALDQDGRTDRGSPTPPQPSVPATIGQPLPKAVSGDRLAISSHLQPE